MLTLRQLPFNVGWQDLKDLFRQAGKLSPICNAYRTLTLSKPKKVV